ncbi:MAG: hypothetical protein VB104_03150 [Candidatus Limiplasma sp.]|nr:hypothetical protein [Candidatus Limiplasma sp.]
MVCKINAGSRCTCTKCSSGKQYVTDRNMTSSKSRTVMGGMSHNASDLEKKRELIEVYSSFYYQEEKDLKRTIEYLDTLASL